MTNKSESVCPWLVVWRNPSGVGNLNEKPRIIENFDFGILPRVPGLAWDESYPVIRMPDATPDSESPGLLLRVMIEVKATDDALKDLVHHFGEKSVFSDPRIDHFDRVITKFKDRDKGTCEEARSQISCESAWKAGMEGQDVLVAVLDTGIDKPYLEKNCPDGVRLSESYSMHCCGSHIPPDPGTFSSYHGTMCAYHIARVAPKCTLIDICILPSEQVEFDEFTSNGILAFTHLRDLRDFLAKKGEYPSIVVNCSWGVEDPSSQLAQPEDKRYFDNAEHPLNLIVEDIGLAGIDVVFAAGNSGNRKGNNKTIVSINGANSHPEVITVGGVDIDDLPVGYSSRGPGTLMDRKPDICAYTHFVGSKAIGPKDVGASVSAAMTSGSICLLRSLLPYDPNDPKRSPAAMRDIIRATSRKPKGHVFDHVLGHGILDMAAWPALK
ncbi:MAG: S8/S53 family peptidase [Planctomycetota bacterium]|nr:S8/S53 family peptidase [Planctomycetota bacterium]